MNEYLLNLFPLVLSDAVRLTCLPLTDPGGYHFAQRIVGKRALVFVFALLAMQEESFRFVQGFSRALPLQLPLTETQLRQLDQLLSLPADETAVPQKASSI